MAVRRWVGMDAAAISARYETGRLTMNDGVSFSNAPVWMWIFFCAVALWCAFWLRRDNTRGPQ